MFVGSFIVLVRQQWIMALIIYLGVVPIMVWFSISQRAKMSAGFKEVREKMADINAQLENALAEYAYPNRLPMRNMKLSALTREIRSSAALKTWHIRPWLFS